MKNKISFRTPKTFRAALLALICGGSLGTAHFLHAATPISFSGTTYSENFDGLPSATPDPTFASAGPFDVPGIAGWSFFKAEGNSAPALFRVGDGSANSGSMYSFGSVGSSDRALGGLASGSGGYQFGAVFTNDTLSTLTSFTLNYNGEQWRYGGSGDRQSPFVFEYSLNAPDITSGIFSPAPSLNLTPTITTGENGGALDGNLAANQTTISSTTSGFLWQPGTTLTIRWTDTNNAGSDDGLAVDDLSFDAVAGSFSTLVWNQTGGDWNTTDANWTGESTVYSDGDLVQFTDANVGTVNLDAGGVSPIQAQVTNTTGTYSFVGGPLTGSGSLVKTGAGTLELGVTTDMTGGITINEGTVRTTDSNLLGDSLAISVNSGGVLDLAANTDQIGNLFLTGGTVRTDGLSGVVVLGQSVNVLADAGGSFIEGFVATNGIAPDFSVADGAAAIDLTISASLLGADRITFEGPGTTALNGDNIGHSGGISLNAGILELASNTSLGTGSLFFNGGTVRASSDLSGANAINVTVSHGGDATVDATANAIEFTSFSTSFGSAAKTLTVLGDVTISGVIANGGAEGQFAGVLNKAGSGTLTLTQQNTYTGITTVQGGTLALADGAGISASSSIRVDAGATFDLSAQTTEYVITKNAEVTQSLQGGGVVVAPTAGLVVNGDLAPGGPLAATLTQTLTIQGGPVTFGSESSLTMQLAGLLGAEFDQLVVSEGLLTLDGTLVLSLSGGFVPTESDQFTIVSGLQGISGAFANAAFGDRVAFADGSFLVSLSGNDVVLSNYMPVPEPTTILLLVISGVALYAYRRRAA